MNENKKIVVMIPCLNEQETIQSVITSFKRNLPNAVIHVFDNNSSDRTKEIVFKNNVHLHNIKYIGKGNVVRRMFADLSGDMFIMIDGDDTYDITRIKDMISYFEFNNLDMLVAKRISVDEEAYRFGHVVGNKIFSRLVKFIFGNVIDDLFSGFRIFSKRFVKSFPGNSRGFEIETELTIHALEQRLPIDEINCKYKSRPKGSHSKLNTFSDGFKILKVLLILIKDEKPLFFFSFLSIFFIFLSLLFGIPVTVEFFNTGLVDKLPSAILAAINMVIAFLCFFSGLILDVIKKHRHEQKRLNYLSLTK